MFVCHFLNLLFILPFLIFGDIFAFHQVLEGIIGVPPNIPDGDLGFFRLCPDHLREFLAPVFGECR